MAEQVYYYLSDGWYKGNEPNFYPEDIYEVGKVLSDHYELIKNEVLSFYQDHGDQMQSNFTPYNYKEQGWKTINLYSYFLKNKRACLQFPVLDGIVNAIPGMCLAQIALLEPQTQIKAHIGDTDAIVRTHLGITIPGQLPEIGLRIRDEERCWKEGETFSFCIVNRHKAWNLTNQHRIIVMVDIIKPEHYEKRYHIAGLTLAAIALKYLANRVPPLKKSPTFVTKTMQGILGQCFTFRLWLQRKLKV